MRAVLDTNIVIDLLHFADPQTQALLQAIADGALRCYSDRQCLSELERVSAYPQFGLDVAAQKALLAGYQRFVTICDGDASDDYPLPRCRDVDDQKFLILAVRCRADLLITRDRLLLKLAHHRQRPQPYAIVTAAAAGALIASHCRPRANAPIPIPRDQAGGLSPSPVLVSAPSRRRKTQTRSLDESAV